MFPVVPSASRATGFSTLGTMCHWHIFPGQRNRHIPRSCRFSECSYLALGVNVPLPWNAGSISIFRILPRIHPRISSVTIILQQQLNGLPNERQILPVFRCQFVAQLVRLSDSITDKPVFAQVFGNTQAPGLRRGPVLYQLSIAFSVSSSFPMLMGLAMWPFIPERRASCLSSSKALAVIARMGILASRGSSSPRMRLVAS